MWFASEHSFRILSLEHTVELSRLDKNKITDAGAMKFATALAEFLLTVVTICYYILLFWVWYCHVPLMANKKEKTLKRLAFFCVLRSVLLSEWTRRTSEKPRCTGHWMALLCPGHDLQPDRQPIKALWWGELGFADEKTWSCCGML